MIDPRQQQLVDRAVRVVRDAVELFGEPAADVVVSTDSTAAQARSAEGVSPRCCTVWPSAAPAFRTGRRKPSVDGSRSWPTTVMASGQPLTGTADHVLGGHDGVVEADLTELLRYR